MCGLAGKAWIGSVPRPPEAQEQLRRMSHAVAHRGPDDEQVHTEPGIALGARRLSIVDYAGATICLFVHQLLALEARGQLRLAPGRTARRRSG